MDTEASAIPIVPRFIAPITPVNSPQRMPQDILPDRIAERLSCVASGSEMNPSKDASVLHFIECRGVARDQAEPRAGAGKAQRNRAPDAGGGAGDDDGAVVKRAHEDYGAVGVLLWSQSARRAFVPG